MCFGFISVLLRWLQRAGDTYAKDACASFVKDFNDSMEEAKVSFAFNDFLHSLSRLWSTLLYSHLNHVLN